MARLSPDSVPKYGNHKQSGQARVVINGRHHLLGPHGSSASRQEYDRLIAEWIANGRRLPDPADERTVSTLIVRFWEHAHAYYRDAEGNDTREADNFRDALGPLRRLYGPTRAADFGPLALKAVRCEMLIKRKVKDRRTDADVNAADFVLFRRLISTPPPSGVNADVLDLNGDGRLNARDLIDLRRRLGARLV